MSEDKAKKERSPSFPFISLEKAVARASTLFDKHKREPARLSAVAPTWGYGVKSSGLLQTVAALKQFGLIEDFGSGDDRENRVGCPIRDAANTDALVAVEHRFFARENMKRGLSFFGHAGGLEQCGHFCNQRFVMFAVPGFVEMEPVIKRGLIKVGKEIHSPA